MFLGRPQTRLYFPGCKSESKVGQYYLGNQAFKTSPITKYFVNKFQTLFFPCMYNSTHNTEKNPEFNTTSV